MLRTKSNDELFDLYRSELALKLRNKRNLQRYYQVLDDFKGFLSNHPPSALLAKNFLGKWQNSKPSTLYKYVGIIRGFLVWYGEELNLKVKLEKLLPDYVDDNDIKKLLVVLDNKRSHKKSILRDKLLIELAYNSGLRREELSNLKAKDILIAPRLLIVRSGKGRKDRVVPLPSSIIDKLQSYIGDMNLEDRLFKLTPGTISDKIHRVAQKAGVKIHTHSLRHAYATRLLEKGANIKSIQELLGHSRIGTTEAYVSLLPKHLRNAVDLLDDKNNNKPDNKFPKMPKLLQARDPKKFGQMFVSEPKQRIYIDEDGNVFEV